MMKTLLKLFNKFLLLFVLALCTIPAMAQNENPDMATTMRSNGKIYVVVAVLSTILVGLIIYLFRLDRKITQLEKSKNIN